MKPSYPAPKLNVQVYQEATEWLIEFRTGSPDERARARLDEWLRASPDHVRAYLEVTSIWENSALHDGERKVSAEQHIARALAEDNVVPLNVEARRDDVESSSRPVKAGRRWAVAASVAFLCVAAGVLTWMHFQGTPTYATQTGEQRSITLDDGSTLEMNARSKVRVRYSEHQRTVELLAGQVLFQVAKDTQRPFIVHSDDVQVRAVGTQFDVYKKANGTIVTVVEGRVAVSSEARQVPAVGSAAPIQLSAGQQVSLSIAKVSPPKQVDLSAATAWTQRRLVFHSVPLREVADEFNRYNSKQIVLEGADLESLAIIGVFSSTDPASLLRFLRTQPGVNVAEDDTRILITQH